MRVLPAILLGALVAPLVLAASAAGPEASAPPPPSWYTGETHARVLAASEKGLAYDAEAGADVPLRPGAFIRPGARIVWPNVCTVGFVFGPPGDRALSTSSHCGDVGQEVVLRIAGPSAILAAVGRVGAEEDLVGGPNYALVSVDAQFQPYVDPCVATLLGPERAYAGGAPQPAVWVSEDGASPRAGTLTGLAANVFHAAGILAPGDEGAPVLVKSAAAPHGEAVGILATVLGAGTDPTRLTGTRVDAIPATLAPCRL